MMIHPVCSPEYKFVKQSKQPIVVEAYARTTQCSQMDRSLDGLLGREAILDAPIVPEVL
jgi:hypothetical protein